MIHCYFVLFEHESRLYQNRSETQIFKRYSHCINVDYTVNELNYNNFLIEAEKKVRAKYSILGSLSLTLIDIKKLEINVEDLL